MTHSGENSVKNWDNDHQSKIVFLGLFHLLTVNTDNSAFRVPYSVFPLSELESIIMPFIGALNKLWNRTHY